MGGTGMEEGLRSRSSISILCCVCMHAHTLFGAGKELKSQHGHWLAVAASRLREKAGGE